ncbi:MAG: patatin-like phospholipase family protein [Terriglobales bacterium]
MKVRYLALYCWIAILHFAVCGVLPSSWLWAQRGGDSRAQSPGDASSPKRRPRIGLVLEGGGALGLAHVGVIKWLEENRIPVDVVAGTSMGGVVGGIYASGESPDQIRTLVRGIPWNKVLGGATPYRDLAFRRKEDHRQYQNALEFGLKHGTQFPSGFNSGQQVGLILDKVGLPYSEMKSFDDLPIPFRCVATDLVSGQKFVFEHGSLAEAMRATMSIPAIFVPVRESGHVFVDGGLLDNLPVDVARGMGADIVIAVHLQTQGLNPNAPLTSVGVLEQSASVSIAVNELASMEKADIVLTANLEKFDTTDYTEFEPIEAEGYTAAQKKSTLLSRLQVDEMEWKQLMAARAAKRRQPATPEFVEVTGPKGDILAGVEHDVAGLAGKPIAVTELDRKMMEITGLGRFAQAGYEETTRGGETGLVIETLEKEYAPPTVHPLFVIDGSDYKNVLFQVGGRITFMDVGGFGSEWRNDFVAGSEYGTKTEFFHPFNFHTGWFAAAHGTADSSPLNVYQRDKILGEYRNRVFGGGLDLGYTFGRSAEMRVGYESGYQKISEDLGEPVAPTVRGRYGMTTVSYRLDRFDDPMIPRRGERIESTFHFYDTKPGTADFVPTAELRLGLAKRVDSKSSVLLSASGGTSFSTPDTGFPPFNLGGPLRLGAYGLNELLTNQYFLVQPAYLYRLKELSPLLKQNVYLLTMYEAGKAYGQPASTSGVAQDGTVGLLFQTIFGPVFFGGSLGDSDHRKFFFEVGRFF